MLNETTGRAISHHLLGLSENTAMVLLDLFRGRISCKACFCEQQLLSKKNDPQLQFNLSAHAQASLKELAVIGTQKDQCTSLSGNYN